MYTTLTHLLQQHLLAYCNDWKLMQRVSVITVTSAFKIHSGSFWIYIARDVRG
jgi:hypothetical protein